MRDLIYRLPYSVLPDPTPVAPPGAEGVTTILNILSWVAIAAGIAGILISVTMMVLNSRGHGTHEGFKGIGVALLGCIIATSVGALLRLFI